MAQIIGRYVKLGVVWGILIGLIVLYDNVGCRQIKGAEMTPALPRDGFRFYSPGKRRPGDQIAADDIVGYEYNRPGAKQTSLTGRVIGLPGDVISIKKGVVYRNKSKVDQSYVSPDSISLDSLEEFIVPRDSFFILMDNRREGTQLDSRATGPVGMYAVAGKIKP